MDTDPPVKGQPCLVQTSVHLHESPNFTPGSSFSTLDKSADITVFPWFKLKKARYTSPGGMESRVKFRWHNLRHVVFLKSLGHKVESWNKPCLPVATQARIPSGMPLPKMQKMQSHICNFWGRNYRRERLHTFDLLYSGTQTGITVHKGSIDTYFPHLKNQVTIALASITRDRWVMR